MSINLAIANNIEFILEKLEIDDYEYRNDKITMFCPIHLGDNKGACVLYLDSDNFQPNWKCFTRGCHKKNCSLIGFVSAKLHTGYRETEEWIKGLGITIDSICESKARLIRETKLFTQKVTESKYKISKNKLKELHRPVQFYLDRGFKEETLRVFGVGICKDLKNYFYNRIVVPVFNDSSEYIVGFVSRTLEQKCVICKKYHTENKPCSNGTGKWINTPGFCTNSYFYNYWNAKTVIVQTKEVILVEGQADVWRIYEAGFKNVIGLFGVDVSYNQRIILEKSGVTTLKFFLDPDLAGREAFKRQIEYLDRMYNIQNIVYEKQPSECNVEEIHNLILKR